MDLRALRSAIHRGDAEAVVSVVASGPWDGRLQLVGDALVMAVERRQPGAEELAGAAPRLAHRPTLPPAV